MSSQQISEEYDEAIDYLVESVPQNARKHAKVIAWFSKHFYSSGRASRVAEVKQAYNRINEQFAHKDSNIVFVADDDNKTVEVLERRSLQEWYPSLNTCLIIRNTNQGFRGEVLLHQGESAEKEFFISKYPGLRLQAFTTTTHAEDAEDAESEDLDLSELVGKFSNAISEAGMDVEDSLLLRIIASLCAKRFLILTGLSGSGKTKVAQAFAKWITHSGDAAVVIPVGADWTGREQLLGYPDGINPDRYVKQAALNLIIKASKPDNSCKPYFLILDEMNLSHVERYFSDFLSAIESEEKIPMHGEGENDEHILDGVPKKLKLPKNLFVIGTVNIDETTYMFSPKVLDRANVLEFRVAMSEFLKFLSNPKEIELNALDKEGVGHGRKFVVAAKLDVSSDTLNDLKDTGPDGNSRDCYSIFRNEIECLFRIFQCYSWDFGFRVGKETSRFVYFYSLLAGSDWKVSFSLDAQIIQKLMPKLNGSESRLSNILKALAWYCSGREKELHEDNTIEGKTPEVRAEAIIKKVADSTADDPKRIYQNLLSAEKKGKYPLSMEKTFRMWNALKINGFTSFAEN